MKLGDVLNSDRVKAMQTDPNAYVMRVSPKPKPEQVNSASIPKVIFPEPYENANNYYNKNDFVPPQKEAPLQQPVNPQPQNNPMFDIKSLLPMLMSGKFNDMLKPLMSMFGGSGGTGGGLGDVSKIFELFKPKSKTKKADKEDEDVSSKFDDMIIIED